MNPGSAVVLSALPSPRGVRAAARSAPDLFQASFQGRLLQHLQREGHLETALARRQGSRPEATGVPLDPPGGRQTVSLRAPRRRPDLSAPPSRPEAVIPPELLPELSQRLTAAGVPEARIQEFLARPEVQTQGVRLGDVWDFLRRWAAHEGQRTPFDLPEGGIQESARLTALLDLMAASPGGVLKIPPERHPEAQLLLEAAGLPPEQAARLLWHPEAAETGLTPEQVRARWLKAHTPEPPEATAPAPPSPTVWRQLWERLRLPPEAWPELKAALQHLGIPPEQLTRLEEAVPDGLPLAQVWELLKETQIQRAAPAAPEELARELAELLDPDPAAAAEAWARLLRQAGLPGEKVASLFGGTSPGSAAELKARLIKLAPEPEPPPAQDAPKPLYLPTRLRLGPLPRQFEGEQPPPDQGSGAPRFPGNPLPSPAPAGQEPAYAAAAQEFLPTAPLPPPAFTGPLASPAGRQAVWAQIENAVLQHLQPGQSQVSLTLNPPELGRVELTLTLKGEHLVVQALVSRPEVAELAQAQVELLIQALARQGVTLSQFQVHMPQALRPLMAAASPEDRPGFRRPEGGPQGNGTSRPWGFKGVSRFV